MRANPNDCGSRASGAILKKVILGEDYFDDTVSVSRAWMSATDVAKKVIILYEFLNWKSLIIFPCGHLRSYKMASENKNVYPDLKSLKKCRSATFKLDGLSYTIGKSDLAMKVVHFCYCALKVITSKDH